VPANADPGTHWGALLISTAPAAGGGTGAAIQVRSGLIILVRVLGDAKEQLTLDSISAPQFLESPPLQIEVRFRNEGTVHEAPQGSIEVKNMFGTLVATGTLPVRNVLPGTVRRMTASVGDGIWFGRYTATLNVTYGAGTKIPPVQFTIWAVPWRTQGWKAAFVLLIIAFAVWKRRNFAAFWYVLRTGLPPPESGVQ
jgi:hypothetical protein